MNDTLNEISEKSNKNVNCIDIKLIKDLTDNSYSKYWLANTFAIFKSLNNIYSLIYADENKSIISYDIISNKKINEIKKAHRECITNFRYYLDLINKRDLILSISSDDNNIKIWNYSNCECLLDIKNINKKGYLHSACFLNINNQKYIIASNKFQDFPESIKVFNFKGEEIKRMSNSNESTVFVDSYYDFQISKNFIIQCTVNGSKSYDYDKNEIYKSYYDRNCPQNAIINKKEEMTELIESNSDGCIRIWNFHSALLLHKIEVSSNTIILREICFVDKEYLFVGCEDKTIRIIDYNNRKIIQELKLKGHKNKVISIKKIIHPQYGKCLLSQAANLDSIKLWVISK